MGQQVLGSDKILRLNDFNLLGLVQSEDWSPNFNSQDIFEMGNVGKLATARELETSGTIELGSIGGMPGLLARMIVTRAASGAFTGYLFSSSGAAGKNAYTITQTDLKECIFDLTIHEKTDQVNFDRSLVLPRCYPTNISGRADANGVASETIAWAGDFVVGLPSPYHDVRSIPATIGIGSDSARLILQDTTVTSSTHKLIYAYIDERRLRTTVADVTYAALDASGGKVTVTGLTLSNFANASCRVLVYKSPSPSSTFPSIFAAVSGTATAGAASTLTDGAQSWTVDAFKGYQVTITSGTGAGQVRIISSNTATVLTVSVAWGTNPDATSKYTIYNRDTTAFFIKGYQANIFLAPATVSSPTTSEQWLKVQSIDWSIDMRVEALRQIAFNTLGSTVYCRVPTFPFNITANISTIETDWKDWKAVLSKTFPGNDVYQDSYDLAPDNLKDPFAVVIEYKTKSGAVLCTWRFTDMSVDGYGNRANIGGRGEISWSLRGTQFTLIGQNN